MHLAHKAEHAVDRNTGAVVAVTLQVLLRNTYGIGTPRGLQGLPRYAAVTRQSPGCTLPPTECASER
jgi:hypothetical protein